MLKTRPEWQMADARLFVHLPFSISHQAGLFSGLPAVTRRCGKAWRGAHK